MIVQSVKSVTDRVLNDLVSRIYRQVVDEKTQKVYYECLVYTRKGFIQEYKDQVHAIDRKV